LLSGSKNSAYVAYAKSTDPNKEADWRDNAVTYLVGGDDFADAIPIDRNRLYRM
jgi:hypothetical protein